MTNLLIISRYDKKSITRGINLAVILLIFLTSIVFNYDGSYWGNIKNPYIIVLALSTGSIVLFFYNRPKFQLSIPDIALFLLIFYQIVSRFIRIGKFTLDEPIVLQVSIYVFYLSLRVLVFDHRTTLLFYKLISVFGVLLALYGILEYFNIFITAPTFWYRINGTFGNPGPFGGFLSVLAYSGN
jgi:hypothetical protein